MKIDIGKFISSIMVCIGDSFFFSLFSEYSYPLWKILKIIVNEKRK